MMKNWVIILGLSFWVNFWLAEKAVGQEVELDSIQGLQDSTIIYQVDSVSDNLSFLQDTVSERKGLVKFLFPGKRPPYQASIAWKRSLIFPGWGQIYNQDYWKLPLVYGSYAVGFWVMQYNDNRYQEYRTGYLERVDEDETNDFNTFGENASTEGIKRARDRFRQFRDRSILAIAGIHILQVIEAYVDAHLNGFDVSDDLTLEILPHAGAQGFSSAGLQPGLSLTWTIK